MTMKRKAFVLLSGGLDSTTCLYIAAEQFNPRPDQFFYANDRECYIDAENHDIEAAAAIPVDWVEAISIDYGQRHVKEAEYAHKTCGRLGIKHTVLHLGDILSGKGVMLTDASVAVPDISYAEIKGVSPTYVPFRNGTMLSVITAYAQKYVMSQIEEDLDNNFGGSDAPSSKELSTLNAKDLCAIYFGAHAEDAANWAYPDCTPEFIGSMANAIYTGTYNTIRLSAPLMSLTKAQIVEWGTKLGVPYENTWSCYKGEEVHCGTCPTCISRKDAFAIAGISDPTIYKF